MICLERKRKRGKIAQKFLLGENDYSYICDVYAELKFIKKKFDSRNESEAEKATKALGELSNNRERREPTARSAHPRNPSARSIRDDFTFIDTRRCRGFCSLCIEVKRVV